MKRIKQYEKWFYGIAIVILLGLFYSSSMTYKQQTSVPFLERYLQNKPFEHGLSQIGFNYGGKYQSVANDGYFKFVEFFIRKGAHFSIYLVLGVFLALALITYFRRNYFLMIFIPWMTTTGGRTPLVEDVILDSAGAFTGIVILIICLYLFSFKNKKNDSK